MKTSMLVVSCVVAFGFAACPAPPDEREPTLSAIRTDIFEPRCSATVCHGNGGARGLDLVNEPFEGLVNVASVADPDILRVAPGDPDASLLYQVLQGPVPDAEVGELQQMPIGAEVDDADLEQIRQWIADGAENN
jgi:hypothetical protein